MFHYPDHLDYHEGVDIPTLEWLESLVQGVDLDRYLPQEMMDLCEDFCQRTLGYSRAYMENMTIGRDLVTDSARWLH